MVRRVARAAEVLASVPGCLEAACWRAAASGAVVATGKWASEAARLAAFRAVREAGVDFDDDEREARPREV